MDIAKTIESVRRHVKVARDQHKTIGLVPTMGALHIGHVSLIQAAARRCDYVVVSIFVNPTQFGPNEDLAEYPRPFDRDCDVCREHGTDLIFAPDPEDMYGAQSLTWVSVETLTEPLCGQFRASHFRGVTTVCTKLFNIVLPNMTFFGQKDAQQAVVIQRMVADLNIPVEVEVCPTVREPDGLAVSSRNQYLTVEQRQQAGCLLQGLQAAEKLVHRGECGALEVEIAIRGILQRVPDIEVQYIGIVDPVTLSPIKVITKQVLVAVAVKLGSVRLIDNILIDVNAM
jgi:pantoate--beta-alanine ligase